MKLLDSSNISMQGITYFKKIKTETNSSYINVNNSIKGNN